MGNSIKVQRRKEILKIIEENAIEKQEELIIELKKRGFKSTQATVSRDLKDLNIVRTPTGNERYKYVIADNNIFMERMKSIFRQAVISVDIQEYFLCVKTSSGMAQIVAETIDCINDKRVVGTVAGNNNIFILCRSIDSAKKIAQTINSIR